MRKPSAGYFKAIEEAKAHHASSKTYSGKFLRPHAPFVLEIIQRLGCRSVLDYGCGKGRQYEWVSHGGDASIPQGMTIEQYWNVPVTKYDPAWPPFAQEPFGQFDLVICTHVLGSIPIRDLGYVIGRVYGLASHAVYIAEKLGPVQKQVFSGSEAMPRGWSADDWRAMLLAVERPKDLEVTLATHERTVDRGVQVTRVRI